MNLKHENIHEYVIKCTNTTQITLDDDFNVMDSKPDIDLIVKEWGMAVVNGVSHHILHNLRAWLTALRRQNNL